MDDHKPPTGRYLAISAFLVMIATILSRILGLGREMTIANVFGASGNTDAFYLAYNIPELIRVLIISGVLGSIFIPIFADFQERRSTEQAKKVSTEIFSFTALLSLGTCLIGILLAPQIIWLAEKISLAQINRETFNTAVELTRTLFPMLIFIALSGVMQGMLNSLHDYKTPAFAPLIFNIVIIGTVLGCKITNPEFNNIYVLAVSVVAGVFLQMIIQVPALKRFGFTLLKIPDFTHEAFKKFWDLAPAAMLGYATMIVNSFVDKAIAFGLVPNGGLTTLSWGFRVQQLPYSIFGVTLVTVLFPSIAQHIAAGRLKELRKVLDSGIRMMAFTVIPSSVFFIAMSQDVIKLLFGHGKFTDFASGVEWTSQALTFYTIGIFPAASLLFLARVFFSFQDTKTPLKAGAIMVVINYALDQILGRHMGVMGIALATSIVALCNCILLIHFLKARLPWIWQIFFNKNILKILIAGAVQFLAVFFLRIKLVELMPESDVWERLITICAGLAVSVIVFGVLTLVMQCGEWGLLKEYVLKRRRSEQESRNRAK